ncbi:hypothetical protein P9112_000491 [Eukaryota sp. TZLM1-RC]
MSDISQPDISDSNPPLNMQQLVTNEKKIQQRQLGLYHQFLLDFDTTFNSPPKPVQAFLCLNPESRKDSTPASSRQLNDQFFAVNGPPPEPASPKRINKIIWSIMTYEIN